MRGISRLQRVSSTWKLVVKDLEPSETTVVGLEAYKEYDMIVHNSGFILKTSEELEREEREHLKEKIRLANELRGNVPLRDVVPTPNTQPRNSGRHLTPKTRTYRSNFLGFAM